MKFDQPASKNPIDQLKVVGQPVDRIDGPLKCTGTAPYAYDRHDVAMNPGVRLHCPCGNREGAHHVDGYRGRQGRIRRNHRRDGAERGQARERQPQ